MIGHIEIPKMTHREKERLHKIFWVHKKRADYINQSNSSKPKSF